MIGQAKKPIFFVRYKKYIVVECCLPFGVERESNSSTAKRTERNKQKPYKLSTRIAMNEQTAKRVYMKKKIYTKRRNNITLFILYTV